MFTVLFTLLLYLVMWFIYPQDVAIEKTTFALLVWVVLAGSVKLLIRAGIALIVFLGGSAATLESLDSSSLLTGFMGGAAVTTLATWQIWAKFIIVEGARIGGAYIMLKACKPVTNAFSLSYLVDYHTLGLGIFIFLAGVIAHKTIKILD